MPGLSHGDAERLGFSGAGDDAAVVVGEDDDRAPLQLRLKEGLAGGVEVVAVDQGEDHG